MPLLNKKHIKLTLVIILSFVLIAMLWFLLSPFKRTNDLEGLRYIGASAGRMMERHLEFYEGYEQTTLLERTLHEFLFGTPQEVQQEALHAYEEVLKFLEQHPESATSWALLNTRARWLITVAEFQDRQHLLNALATFDNNPEEEVIAEAVKFAYLDDYSGFTPEIFTGATMVPTGWAKDRLRLRINTKLDKPYFINFFGEQLKRNGQRLRQHLLQMALAIILVIITGLYMIIRYKVFYIPSPWSSDLNDKPWKTLDGLLIASLSAVCGLLIWFGLHLLSTQFFRPNFFTMWSTLFASLPMLWLMHKFLLKPRGQNLISAFGLNINRFNFLPFLTITGSLLALELSGLMLIGWGTWKLGLESHWASGIQERLVFGQTDIVLFSMINVIVWAPIFEEIGFRGLLYTTLRSRLTPTVAIVISAIIFSALHLKSLHSFLSIFWSGLILAYAYERYRSLLPGMVIHSVGNIIYLSTILLFYR